MLESRIYVGLDDKDSHEQHYDTEHYKTMLKAVCKDYNAPFSMQVIEGGYFHDDGEYTEETSFVLVLINADRKVVNEIAKDLCSFFHQESVLVTENRMTGYFTGGIF